MSLAELAWLLFGGVLGLGLTLLIPAIGSLWGWLHAPNVGSGGQRTPETTRIDVSTVAIGLTDVDPNV